MLKELPLQELFNRLRKSGLPLGIDEYHLMLQALQGGFGSQDQLALRKLCYALWTKTLDERCVLDYHFDKVMAQVSCDELEGPQSEKVKDRLRILALGMLSSLILGSLFMSIPGLNNLHLPSRQTEEYAPPQNGQPIPDGTSQSSLQTLSPYKLLRSRIEFLLFAVMILATNIFLAWLVYKVFLRNLNATALMNSNQDLSRGTQFIGDEIEATQAVQLHNIKVLTERFQVSGDYLPVTQRQMKRVWRYLSRPVREGTPTELDINATIKAISRHGVLLEPVLIPPRVNRALLLLLIDYDGSMVPFKALTTRLVSTARRGGCLGGVSEYYFHNCPAPAWDLPGDFLIYSDVTNPTSAEYFNVVLDRFSTSHLSVLIVSDAGAARGGFSQYRIEKTQTFLKILQKKVRSIAWINPLPRQSWKGTTAEALSAQIPMFSADFYELDSAVNTLRGKYLRHNIDYDDSSATTNE